MKKNIEILSTLILFLIVLILFFVFPKTIMESVTFSISIWKDNLLPSIFPFLILGNLLTTYGISYFFSYVIKSFIKNILHLPTSCGFIIILSCISGFPSNAIYINNALKNKEIDIKTANELLCFCFYPNPLFVIGTVGTLLLGDTRLGIIILISQTLASFIIAFLKRGKNIKEEDNFSFIEMFSKIKDKISSSKSFIYNLKGACLNSLNTMFLLLGIITVFLIIANLISIFINLSIIPDALFRAALEMTQGLKAVSYLKEPLLLRTILMSSILSFGGVCIHAQIFSILEDFSFSYFKFLIFRIIHSILSMFLTFIFFMNFYI